MTTSKSASGQSQVHGYLRITLSLKGKRFTALDTACRKAVPLYAVDGMPIVVERLGGDLMSGSSDASWLCTCRPAVP